MGKHDEYGKRVMKLAAGPAFLDWGESICFDYVAGCAARIDGTVAGKIAVEVESRVPKQIRGAVMDLIWHPFTKKLMVLLPVHMHDVSVVADHCRVILKRFCPEADFRVIALSGSGENEMLQGDVQRVQIALAELGFGTVPMGFAAKV